MDGTCPLPNHPAGQAAPAPTSNAGAWIALAAVGALLAAYTYADYQRDKVAGQMAGRRRRRRSY